MEWGLNYSVFKRSQAYSKLIWNGQANYVGVVCYKGAVPSICDLERPHHFPEASLGEHKTELVPLGQLAVWPTNFQVWLAIWQS